MKYHPLKFNTEYDKTNTYRDKCHTLQAQYLLPYRYIAVAEKPELSGCKGMIIKNIYNLFYIKKRNFSMQSIAGKKLWQKKKGDKTHVLSPLSTAKHSIIVAT